MNKFLIVIMLLTSSANSGLLSGCSDEVTDAQHLVKAEEYFNAGNMNTASIELKNALQKNSNNPRARLLLGRLNLEMGIVSAAEKELAKASELGIEDELILPLKSRALLLQGKIDEVQRLSTI